MTIDHSKSADTMTVALSGRLDTTTAPQLEQLLKGALDGVRTLIFDFESLSYISSAGLRVLLGAQKTMNRQGAMTIRNVNPEVMEIFEITGFSDILTIE